MIHTIWGLLPILCLLICLLLLKVSAIKASFLTFLITSVLSISIYKVGLYGLSISISKGLGLALFVLMIVWSAILLYNLVSETDSLSIISKNIETLVKDEFLQFLVLCWIFAPFLQGIAGFGVPVIVVTPLLIKLGFDPYKSAAGVLIGHSWSISFGSMGSSIYAIGMVTETDLSEIVLHMSLFGVVGLFFTGMAVTIIYQRGLIINRTVRFVLPLSILMGSALIALSFMEVISAIGLVTGLTGLIISVFFFRLINKNLKMVFYRDKMSFFEALLPYLLIICISLATLFIQYEFIYGIDYPGYTTGLGRIIPEEISYVSFNILKFPFTIIIFSVITSYFYYRIRGIATQGAITTIIKNTIIKCKKITVIMAFLLCIAVIMMDAGMIEELAHSLVSVTDSMYPLIAPFIGMLGAFITGSNTNSNILFGSLQELASVNLGISTAATCAAQSIGASIGGGIGPTTVALGATAAGVQGNEPLIYRKTFVPVIITVLILGVFNTIVFN